MAIQSKVADSESRNVVHHALSYAVEPGQETAMGDDSHAFAEWAAIGALMIDGPRSDLSETELSAFISGFPMSE